MSEQSLIEGQDYFIGEDGSKIYREDNPHLFFDPEDFMIEKIESGQWDDIEIKEENESIYIFDEKDFIMNSNFNEDANSDEERWANQNSENKENYENFHETAHNFGLEAKMEVGTLHHSLWQDYGITNKPYEDLTQEEINQIKNDPRIHNNALAVYELSDSDERKDYYMTYENQETKARLLYEHEVWGIEDKDSYRIARDEDLEKLKSSNLNTTYSTYQTHTHWNPETEQWESNFLLSDIDGDGQKEKFIQVPAEKAEYYLNILYNGGEPLIGEDGTNYSELFNKAWDNGSFGVFIPGDNVVDIHQRDKDRWYINESTWNQLIVNGVDMLPKQLMEWDRNDGFGYPEIHSYSVGFSYQEYVDKYEILHKAMMSQFAFEDHGLFKTDDYWTDFRPEPGSEAFAKMDINGKIYYDYDNDGLAFDGKTELFDIPEDKYIDITGNLQSKDENISQTSDFHIDPRHESQALISLPIFELMALGVGGFSNLARGGWNFLWNIGKGPTPKVQRMPLTPTMNIYQVNRNGFKMFKNIKDTPGAMSRFMLHWGLRATKWGFKSVLGQTKWGKGTYATGLTGVGIHQAHQHYNYDPLVAHRLILKDGLGMSEYYQDFEDRYKVGEIGFFGFESGALSLDPPKKIESIEDISPPIPIDSKTNEDELERLLEELDK